MTSDAVNQDKRGKSDEGWQLSPEQAAAAAMVAEARQRGLELTGPDGLLKLFTKNVLETALSEEITGHLGYEKNQAGAGRESGNVRNGARAKTVISDAVGEVRIDVPRDRAGTFGPQIVKKRQRRLTDMDEIALSLYGVRLSPARAAGQSFAHALSCISLGVHWNARPAAVLRACCGACFRCQLEYAPEYGLDSGLDTGPGCKEPMYLSIRHRR